MMLLRDETTKDDGTQMMSDEEIVSRVLGTKSGYIKGRGFGPQPPSTRNSQSTVHEMYEKYKDLEHTIQVQSEEIEALKAQGKRFEEFMANYYNKDDDQMLDI